jgi:hypothetical protein
MTLRYSVKVRAVREATAGEIEEAAASLDEAHEHQHGPDCDHTHEGPVTSSLVRGERDRSSRAPQPDPTKTRKLN